MRQSESVVNRPIHRPCGTAAHPKGHRHLCGGTAGAASTVAQSPLPRARRSSLYRDQHHGPITTSEYPCCQGCVSLWISCGSAGPTLPCRHADRTAEGSTAGRVGGDGWWLAFGPDGGRRGSPPPGPKAANIRNVDNRLNRTPRRGLASTADPASTARWPAPPACA